MIEQKNGEQILEYKFPSFISENYNLGNSSDNYEILQASDTKSNFSKVLKVKSKTNSEIYVMKKVIMKKILNEHKDEKYFENEILILKRLNDPSIIKCCNIFQENNYLYFIMEFMNNGDLESYYQVYESLNKSQKIQIPEEKLWDIFYKCLKGLDYIHRQGLIHRDIKLKNLFFDDNLNIKIGDYNISVAVDEKKAKNFIEEERQIKGMVNDNLHVGTPGYIAPEILNNMEYDQKVDVYSMGVVFFQLCYFCKPINVRKEDYYKKGIYSPELNSLIDRMININKNNRISSSEAFSIAKKYFIKKYVKNSSVESILYCFNNFPNFSQYFCNNNNIEFLTDNKREIGTNVFNVIQSFKNNNKDDINDNLFELRKNVVKGGLNINQDNIEIDPGKFISFFIKKLNSELNEIITVKETNDYSQFMILSSSFTFPTNREEDFFNQFINIYNKRLLSLISRNFFSIIRTRKKCTGCGIIQSSFSMFHFIPFNVEILSNKQLNNVNLHLKNCFNCLCNDFITLTEEKKIKCNNCKCIRVHYECKKFYHTAKNLIIFFDRGENCQNTKFVNFDEDLELNSNDVERYKFIRYKLIGVILKKEDNNKDEYISFIMVQNNNWISNRDGYNIISLEEVKKKGIVVALFYYCFDDSMILESISGQNCFLNNNNFSNQPSINSFNNNRNNIITSMPNISRQNNGNTFFDQNNGTNNSWNFNNLKNLNSFNNNIGINNVIQGNNNIGFNNGLQGNINMGMNNIRQGVNNMSINNGIQGNNIMNMNNTIQGNNNMGFNNVLQGNNNWI